MPPISVTAACTNCATVYNGFQLKTDKLAQNHANRMGHTLNVWRKPGGFMYAIKPTRAYTRNEVKPRF